LFEQRYEILEKIGEGANGFVNKCRKLRSGKIYAVKSLMMEEEHIMELKENFLAIYSLDHPNIVKYKALYIDMRKKLCYIVMEYINLPSL
jgi:serine/threonine protein kinase